MAFKDLSKACPKNDLPLPNIDTLVDATAGHEMFSFMDGFSRYNQIRMALGDVKKTAFRTLSLRSLLYSHLDHHLADP
ncbi:Uncharacterized protein TCM_012462 [Theobroma cacao]|uniref:Reverse transcriptase domain-containing protein n=1 Tax=Theobroma cacao TaxID=3641 RepID=A0A061FW72_THECC|nr:Uncharacterized protein TCM_012462 [Theobroma cacao]